MEVSAEFLKDDFNVEIYARKLLEENASVAEQLAKLGANTAALDRQLKEQVKLINLGLLILLLFSWLKKCVFRFLLITNSCCRKRRVSNRWKIFWAFLINI